MELIMHKKQDFDDNVCVCGLGSGLFFIR